MGKGAKPITQTQTTAPAPEAMEAYRALLARAQGVAGIPYEAYGGELVAPFNAQQNLGITGINAASGYAQPYIQQAAQYANEAAAPISGGDIQRYLDPYTQQVVNATQAQFANRNAQQQTQVVGNAAMQGALGGDRVAVAQAELARQQNLAQNPVIAGLYSQGYGQALNTALAEQQQRAQGAYSLGNLGISGQGAALQGAGAQFGAGTQQQQTQQAADTAAYQQYLQRLAFPYQQTGWLGGLTTGIGTQMGGTAAGATTYPPPSMWSQIFGAGLGGLGMIGATGGFGQQGWLTGRTPQAGAPGSGTEGVFGSTPLTGIGGIGSAHRGGRITLAGGGIAMPYEIGEDSFIPTIAMTPGKGVPALPPMPTGGQQQQQGGIGIGDIAKIAMMFAHHGGRVRMADGGMAAPYGRPGIGFIPSIPLAPGAGLPKIGGLPSATGPQTNVANMANQAAGIARMMRSGTGTGTADDVAVGGGSASGGAVTVPPRNPMGIYIPQGYDDGGLVSGIPGRDPNVWPIIRPGFDQTFGDIYQPTTRDRDLALGMAQKYDPEAAISLAVPPGTPPGTRALDDTGGNGSALAFGPEGPRPGLAVPPTAPPSVVGDTPSALNPTGGIGAGQLKEDTTGDPRAAAGPSYATSPWLPLVAAGFGMMASRSPYFGVAVGEGGLQGVKAAGEMQTAAQQQQRINLEAQRLSEQARQHAAVLAETTRFHTGSLTQSGAQLAEAARYHKDLSAQQKAQLEEQRRQHDVTQMRPVEIGVDKYGNKIYALPDPKTGGYRVIDPTTGQLGPMVTPKVPIPTPPTATPPAAPSAATDIPSSPNNAATPVRVASLVLPEMHIPADNKGVPQVNAAALLPTEATVAEGNAPKGLNPGVLAQYPEMAETIKGISEGRIQLPPRSFNTPYGKRLLEAVTQYDPSFDQTNVNTRRALRVSYLGGGKASDNVASFNMVMHHTGQLEQAIKDLADYHVRYFPGEINPAISAYYSRTDPEYQRRLAAYDTKAHAVALELAKAFRGVGSSTLEEIRAWEKRQKATNSPVDQLAGAKAAVELLGGRIEAQGDRWNSSMGPASQRDPLSWLSPHARIAYDRFTSMNPVDKAAEFAKGNTASPAPAAGPPRIGSKADYDKLAPGTEFIGDDGKRYRKP